MRPSNYDLQAQAAGHSFAAQDLDAIAARFALRRDETYLYLELLHEPLRLSRTDGAAERQHDGVWMPAPFGAAMTARRKGVIVNFCSESALRPLTRVVGYGAAKAAIANYTKYMAAELAMKFSPEMRVNAIVPGFLLTNQNRALLTNEDGSYTDRARTIIAHTPAGRFAEPEELLGTIHYLVSDASSFVTGALAVVDGGFDAFSI